QARQGSLLLVANKGDHTLGLIDPVAGRQIHAIDVGGVTGHEVVASRDGRLAYVPIYGDSGVGRPGTDGSTLSVVDLRAGKVTANVDFGHGVRPHCVAIGAKDGLLYVSTELDQAIAVIDPRTLKVIARIPTGAAESHMFAISSDGRRAYTANVGPGSVSVLDLETRKLITVIPVAPRVQRVVLSPDRRLVFTADQSKPQLAVIDTATHKVTTWIPLPAIGYGGAVTPDGRLMIVPLRSGNRVAVVDLDNQQVIRTIDVPASPQEVLIPPDGKVAYVSCDASRKVAVIRFTDWSVEKLIDTGPSADGLGWATAE
ncbi:MAG TPA: cytochrome D1 domain-containing protein, partial [Terriglobales bacterium]|nr:cytochrome D1 domain-containing protein [Terriglobales bacterium]